MRKSFQSIVCFIFFLFGIVSSLQIKRNHGILDNQRVKHEKPNIGRYELRDYDPVANVNATVISGNARFTVLTDRLIRMEYSTNGFEDRATLAILNRNLNVPAFTVETSTTSLQITTSKIQLKYQVGASFSSSSLFVQSTDPSSAFTNWTYGQADDGNLLGTIKSLDNVGVISLNCTENAFVIVNGEILHCEWGLISKNGWAIVDDTPNYALDKNYWWNGKNKDTIDIYLFAHGHDYQQALTDFTLISGQIPMIPRFAMGIWWSRWFDLNNYDTAKIVYDYESRGLPLDVFVLDMDWHTKEGWGGYTFDSRLFPNVSDSMQYLKQQKGLRVTVNLHDADGVRSNEAMHDAMAIALNLDPKTCGTIPFSMINSSIVYALEDIVLYDLEAKGVDFFWIDWQQGGSQGGCVGDKQNPTIWTDRIRTTDHLRRGENVRGIVLARWGGLGSHRYQVGFSGDVNALTWQNLAFQPYFSLTASNVAYGFWSHDIVGPAFDHELHTRWIQFGAYSGVFRTHDRGMSGGSCADNYPPDCGIVEVWKVPTPYFEANRAAMQQRTTLLPYIYTAVRKAFETGVSLIRPMYYEFPELKMAYAATPSQYGQYMFGDDMMAAPVVVAADKSTGMAKSSIWIPPGLWVEKDSGLLITGSPYGTTIYAKNYDLTEIPIFVRAGAVIASIPYRIGQTGLAAQQYSHLSFSIFPGATMGSTSVYEDDGETYDYLQDEYAWTTASYSRSSTALTFTVETDGHFDELPTQRSYDIRIVNSFPPSSVRVNGQSIPYSRFGGVGTWMYDGNDMTTIIETSTYATSTSLVVEVTTMQVDNLDTLLSGVKGALKHAILSKLNLDESRVTLGSNDPSGGKLMSFSSLGGVFSNLAGYDLSQFLSKLTNIASMFSDAQQEVETMKSVNPQRLAYSIALLDSVQLGIVQ